MTHLFNSQDQDALMKFFADNLQLNVFLQDDIIIKEGDISGPDEFFYIIIEGYAEVIQEKRDFIYYDFDETLHFLKAEEDVTKSI